MLVIRFGYCYGVPHLDLHPLQKKGLMGQTIETSFSDDRRCPSPSTG